MKNTIETLADVKNLVRFLIEMEKESPPSKSKKLAQKMAGRLEGMETVLKWLENTKIERR